MEAEAEERRLAREHAVTIKRLELDIVREKNDALVELRRLESNWNAILKLPSLVIKLPLYLLFGMGYVISCIRNGETTKEFWNYLR
jgi:hypothetical protein